MKRAAHLIDQHLLCLKRNRSQRLPVETGNLQLRAQKKQQKPWVFHGIYLAECF